MKVTLRTRSPEGWVRSSTSYCGYIAVKQDGDRIVFTSETMPTLEIERVHTDGKETGFKFIYPGEPGLFESLDIEADLPLPPHPARRTRY